MEFLYCSNLLSAWPIFWGICRKRILELFVSKPTSKDYMITNVVSITIAAGIKLIPNLRVDDIANLNGSICCFFLIYLIPAALRLGGYHG